jgi:hypothetical protein
MKQIADGVGLFNLTLMTTDIHFLLCTTIPNEYRISIPVKLQ